LNPLLQALLLALVGFLSAVVNTLAGGGTLLTVPAMILLGYAPLTANATNRFTLIAQGLGATAHYRRKGIIDIRMGLRLSVVACIFSVAGAYLATILAEDAFRHVLAVLMVCAAVFLVLRPARWFAGRKTAGPPRRLLTFLGFAVVGLYGGFFGAGIGVLILIILATAQRMDLVAGNAVKSLVVTCLSATAAAVFAWRGEIDYLAAVPLLVGNGLGGWLGAHLSIKGGDVWIRRALLVVVLASVYKLLW